MRRPGTGPVMVGLSITGLAENPESEFGGVGGTR